MLMTTRKPNEKDFWVCRKCNSPMIETQEYMEDIEAYIRRAICPNCGYEVKDIVKN